MSLTKPSFVLEQGEFADKQINILFFRKLYVYMNVHKLIYMYIYIHTDTYAYYIYVCVLYFLVLNYTLENAQW